MIHLFVYGTLLPGEVRWPHLEPFVVDEGIEDATPGALFDTGLDYPAASFGGDSTIFGRTFTLLTATTGRALDVLDEIEGAVEGEYRRTRVTTERGLVAWAYEYGGGVGLSPIESGSWLVHLHRVELS